ETYRNRPSVSTSLKATNCEPSRRKKPATARKPGKARPGNAPTRARNALAPTNTTSPPWLPPVESGTRSLGSLGPTTMIIWSSLLQPGGNLQRLGGPQGFQEDEGREHTAGSATPHP